MPHRSRPVRIRDARFILLSASCLLISGCANDRAGATRTETITRPESLLAAESREAIAVPPELNRANEAALHVAFLPPVDARTQAELALHCALYRAAHDLVDSDTAPRIILIPIHEMDDDRARGATSISPAEFQIRILAHMRSLDHRASFGTTEAARMRHHVVVLEVRILDRIVDQATVRAEIAAYASPGHGARQQVTAIWDGAAWRLEPGSLRIDW